jgi:hypothetical protein
MKKEVIRHLKGDIKGFKKEASEDRALIKKLKHKKHEAKESKKHEKAEHKKKHHAKKKHAKKKMHETPKRKAKIAKVMREFKHSALHSSSKKGPVVKNKRQALAIALSEARKV